MAKVLHTVMHPVEVYLIDFIQANNLDGEEIILAHATRIPLHPCLSPDSEGSA